MIDWQLMETAPKDGTSILLYLPELRGGHRVQIGHWSKTEHREHDVVTYKSEKWWWGSVLGGILGKEPEPTYWAPINLPSEV